MEYNVPLCVTADFSLYSYYFILFTRIEIDLEDNCRGNDYRLICNTHS